MTSPGRIPIASVSRRFGMAHMMVGVGLFAVLFSVLEVLGVRQLGAPWMAYVASALFCMAVPLAQTLLYGGKKPRQASCLAGMFLLPLIVVVGVSALLLDELAEVMPLGLAPFLKWSLIGLIVVFLALAAGGVGCLLGYLVGTVSAGVFLVVDRRWDAGKLADTRQQLPTASLETAAKASLPTGIWCLDLIAASAGWLWKDRRQPGKMLILVTAPVGAVLMLGVAIRNLGLSLPFHAWGTLLIAAAVATPLLGFTLTGLLHGNWRIPAVFSLLGVVGSIVPVCLLTPTWAWQQATSQGPLSALVKTLRLTVVDGRSASGMAIGILVSGIAVGCVAAGLYGWTRALRSQKTGPAGRRTAWACGIGLTVLLALANAAAFRYANSPRETAIREILRGGGHLESSGWFSVDYAVLGPQHSSGKLISSLDALTDLQDVEFRQTWRSDQKVNPIIITREVVRCLGRLPRLTRLAFQECVFSGGAFGDCPPLGSLRHLEFQGCVFSGETFGDCPPLGSLRHLEFTRCRLTGGDMKMLRGCTSLTTFVLTGSGVEGTSLCGPETSPQTPHFLGCIKHLERVTLNRVDASGGGLAELENLATLWSLNLDFTGADDDTLAQLPPLPALAHLSLGGTKITSKGLVHLKKFPSLQRLALSGCDIGDEALETLRSLPLDRLELSGTRVTGEAKMKLEELQGGEGLLFGWQL